MPLDNIIERIMNDAREEAEETREKARREADRIRSEAREKGREEYDRRMKAARRSAEQERDRKTAMASLEARNSVLEEKQSLIQQVFEEAVSRITGMPVEEYEDLLARQLMKVVGEEGGELILSPRDRERLGRRVVEKANESLERAGSGGRLELADETRNISGGFILRSGGIEINNSLESQIGSLREELEPSVVEELFGEKD